MIACGKGRWACALLALLACSPAARPGAVAPNRSPLLDRMIAARGGAIGSIAREVDARAHAGVPGEWRWEMASCPPERLRWTLRTYGENQTYSFDGARALVSLGSASLPADAQTGAGLRSLARWLAVTNLDVLRDPARATWREIPAGELARGIAHGIRAEMLDDRSSFALFFDARNHLVIVEGPLDLPGVGRGRVRARSYDHRSAGGYVLPYATVYSLDGRVFLEERVLRFTPNASCAL